VSRRAVVGMPPSVQDFGRARCRSHTLAERRPRKVCSSRAELSACPDDALCTAHIVMGISKRCGSRNLSNTRPVVHSKIPEGS